MITNDQRKRYWVELHAVIDTINRGSRGDEALTKSSPSPGGEGWGEGERQPSRSADIDTFRHDFHAQHNLPASTKDFTRAHFDTFLAACRAITQSGDLKPQLRALDQPKARLLHKILVEQAAQLKALGHTDPAISIGQISSQKFHGRKPHDLSDVPRSRARPSHGGEGGPHGPGEGERNLDDSPKRYSELDMLMFTVARMISEQRQARGWTVHELLWQSGLGKTCQCADCKKGRVRRSARTVPAPQLVTADNVPF
jgi:hypothetical protein